MFVNNIRLDVIATYKGDLEQDHFECAVTKKSLKNEKTLLNYITKQFRVLQNWCNILELNTWLWIIRYITNAAF